jgi:hypothetical protein
MAPWLKPLVSERATSNTLSPSSTEAIIEQATHSSPSLSSTSPSPSPSSVSEEGGGEGRRSGGGVMSLNGRLEYELYGGIGRDRDNEWSLIRHIITNQWICYTKTPDDQVHISESSISSSSSSSSSSGLVRPGARYLFYRRRYQ